MQGSLGEFTLAELLQLFALAEKTGTLSIRVPDRVSTLYLEAGRIAGWGNESFDVHSSMSSCELLSSATVTAIESVAKDADAPGLAFVVRNLVEPARWEAFVHRLIEQDVYPLLSLDSGEFEITIDRLPPVPLGLNISVQQIVLDGSRWEADMNELAREGYGRGTRWRRVVAEDHPTEAGLSQLDWLVWSILDEPQPISQVAARLCHPDIETVESVKRLNGEGILTRVV